MPDTSINSQDFEVTLAGVDNVTKWLAALDPWVRNRLKKNFVDVGFVVQRGARRLCPYKEGNLERSITFEAQESQVKIFVPINSPAGRYAREKHDGTYRLGAGSRAKGADVGPKYITRTIDKERQKIISLIGAGLGTI